VSIVALLEGPGAETRQVEAIEAFMDVSNQSPKPFVRTARPDKTLETMAKARAKLKSIQPGFT